jgi:hypothetical protein
LWLRTSKTGVLRSITALQYIFKFIVLAICLSLLDGSSPHSNCG